MEEIIFLVIAIFIAGILGLVYLVFSVASLKYQVREMQKRLDAVEMLRGYLEALKKRMDQYESPPPEPEPAPEKKPEPLPLPEKLSVAEKPPEISPEEMPPPLPKPPVEMPKPATASPRIQVKTPPPEPPVPLSRSPELTDAIRAFFTGGNVVVRVGVIILFFGVAFLLKYAAAAGLFPIEFRLMGVGAGGIAMLVIGWRLREKRTAYGLILQGGAVGILYATLFVAAKRYGLIPLPLAFGLMAALSVLSGFLAVLQDSLALAAFGSAGGFLAPVLTSSGSGSHVMLFSYYAILNAGILLVAWFRAWRVLNLIGFAFTFVIGAAWGFRAYRPENFATTEPFLILFFLFFVVISILFAHRQPPRLKGYVDGTLVFGLPIIVFALQTGLIRRFEYGLAMSALALSIFYIGLASMLWNRKVEGMRMLTEAFLALGVVFGSLAVPLALDGRWTAAAWAMEGAALIWVGGRQNRLSARLFGLLLQFGGGMFFLIDLRQIPGSLPVINGVFLGGMLIALAGLFSAWYLERHAEKLRRWETGFHVLVMIWGLFWWFGTGINEIEDHLRHIDEGAALLLFAASSCGLMGWLSERIRWRTIKYPALGLLPVACLATFLLIADKFPSYHLFQRWHAVSWVAVLGFHLYLLRILEEKWPAGAVRVWHTGGLILAVFIFTWEAAWQVRHAVSRSWSGVVWGLLPGLVILVLQHWGDRIKWPIRRFSGQYNGAGAVMLWGWLCLWEFAACFKSGNPRPLPYIPILNPMDIIQIFGFLTLFSWVRTARNRKFPDFAASGAHGLYYTASALVFLWLNSVVARTVHFQGGVPFTSHALYNSPAFQAAISILWTLTAFGVMTGGSRKGSRNVWYTGGVLLFFVVLKLFFVDLDGVVARIISFIAVGILMLVMGYVAPPPPRKEEVQK